MFAGLSAPALRTGGPQRQLHQRRADLGGRQLLALGELLQRVGAHHLGVCSRPARGPGGCGCGRQGVGSRRDCPGRGSAHWCPGCGS
jgi:hypothetical protein